MRAELETILAHVSTIASLDLAGVPSRRTRSTS